jgi:hypothetical protein
MSGPKNPGVAAIERDLKDVEEMIKSRQDWLEKTTAGAERTRREFLERIAGNLRQIEKAKINLAEAERMRDELKDALLVLNGTPAAPAAAPEAGCQP